MFLQEFGDHNNIIKLHNVIKAENDKDIYLVFEFMGKKTCICKAIVFSYKLIMPFFLSVHREKKLQNISNYWIFESVLPH